MVKISVIGICGNSVFMQVDHFHKTGETLIAQSIHEEIGGKGFNQAIAAARMNSRVSFLAAVGKDPIAQKSKTVLAQNGITPHLIDKDSEKSAVAFILTDKNGENYVTEFEGAHLTVEDVEKFKDEIINSDILLLQHEVSNEVNVRATEIAVGSGVKVILNPAPARKVDDHIAKSVFAVTPNEQEAMVISSIPFNHRIITLGSRGCCINDKEYISALPVKVVNTTGAGDVFNGVLAVCIAEGKDLIQACKYAVAASGISVSKPNVVSSIPYRDEIEAALLKY